MIWLVLILVAPVAGFFVIGLIAILVCVAEETYNGCMDLKKWILS